MTKADRVIDRALALAKKRGMNQTEFGEAMGGVTPAMVTNWKKRDMPSDQHGKAAAALGITVEELLGTRAGTSEGGHGWPLRSISRDALAALPVAKLEQIDQILAAVLGTPVPPDWRSSAFTLAGELDKMMKTTHNLTLMETVDKHHMERVAEHQRQHSGDQLNHQAPKKQEHA